MKYLSAMMLCMCLLACSRQPVRVGATNPTMSDPIPAEVQADPTPERADEAARPAPTTTSADGPLAPTTTTRPTSDGQNPTPDLDIPVVDTETNGTANIERQGSVGEAPLGGAQKDILPDANTRMQLTKGACFGDCDVYTLQLLRDNRVVLSVTNGLQGPGTYELDLSGVAARDLASSLESLRQEDLALQYPDDPDAALPVDAQVTRLTLPDANDELRTITIYYDAPPALAQFVEQVQAFVEDALTKKTTTDR
ncbi:hypothetical protein LEM8419_00965 [Neolewinella maritima]|uniref:DUF6438 domain-containing protein n=1 Tax=Neolewinella maritima TaxID=1383882 RepID=A0ABN8F0U4_9BACT|nr:DUF6438 domain-containing protein [Neolewinella maritima]CAH0999665.1 hypothetical protein LEM8419_00965 [Neolewinella maritima]